MFRVTDSTIDTISSQARDDAGGTVVFEGRVRDHNDGREVRSLEYEIFEELAVKTGNELLEEARSRFDILECSLVHRVGHLKIGEVAIRVEVLGAHRRAAFEACGWIVDETKRRVPIWKKEHYADGDSGWILLEHPSPP